MKIFRTFISILLLLGVVVSAGFCDDSQPADQGAIGYDAHNRRDPLWPLVDGNGNIVAYNTDLLITDLSLQGIIYDASGKSLAIINGNVLKQGQNIGPFVIELVNPESVVLRKDDQRFELKLEKGE